jgi:hypothetical protein
MERRSRLHEVADSLREYAGKRIELIEENTPAAIPRSTGCSRRAGLPPVFMSAVRGLNPV